MDNEQQQEEMQMVADVVRKAVSEGYIEAQMTLSKAFPPYTEQIPVNRESMEQILWCNVYTHILVTTQSETTATDFANSALKHFNKRFPK